MSDNRPRALSKFWSLGIAILAFLVCTVSLPAGQTAQGTHGVVAAIHPMAAKAALETMQEGGNAIDAAVTAALVLGVVDGFNSGIGGGCFFLLRDKTGNFEAIDGREKAPNAATRSMFYRDGKADTALSQNGALAAGVPGSIAAYDYAVKHYGRLPFRRHLMKAAGLAESGFPITSAYLSRLISVKDQLFQDEAARLVFFHGDGSLLKVGEILHQQDLAETYKNIADHGADWFYKGPFARTTGAWMSDHHGVLSAADFAEYKLKKREPLVTTYRGYEIIGFPPPSSGGIHVAQILNILENFDLQKWGPDSPLTIHVIAEAMKLAFADRAFWLGDPDYAKVPKGLASKAYAKELASQIRLDQVIKVPGHGSPPESSTALFSRHTTHFSTADMEGNWVACTATLNTTFGAKIIIPGSGVVLNNQMDDFSIESGVPNFFGLVGAEANAVEPGKRPLSSMSPTIIQKGGVPLYSLGGAGGPTIISQTVLTIVRMIDFAMPLEKAMAAPRFHQQWQPDKLVVEKSLAESILTVLRQLGHNISLTEQIGASQAAGFEGNKLVGFGEPRVSESSAQAF